MRSTEFRSRFVLYVLLLTYISNQWCRYLLNYLYAVPGSAAPHGEAEAFASLRASVGLTDEQYGVLAGYAFSVCYVGAGLLMGRAADTRNRRNIIVLGMVLWNGATVATGLSTSFAQLVGARVVLGIGEAFSAPASYSLIADYFPAEGRGEANGIYAFGAGTHRVARASGTTLSPPTPPLSLPPLARRVHRVGPRQPEHRDGAADRLAQHVPRGRRSTAFILGGGCRG